MSKRFLFLVVYVFLGLVSPAVSAQQEGVESPHFVGSIHGNVEIQEPILQELLASPVMQRLKHIQQYGAYSIAHPFKEGKTYTRYVHSIGVMKMVQLAKEKGADISLAQIIAALLHDCSHTAFSHATDPLFMNGFTNGNYQDKIHATFLREQGILDLINKYGLSLEDVLPDNPEYTALEQPSPTLCADRLEYNLYSGYLTGLLSAEDRQAILDDIRFENDKWFFTKPELALKLARVSLYDTLHTWGSPSSMLTSLHTSKALKILLAQKKITLEDIQYNKNDKEIWEIMVNSSDPEIKQCANNILNIDKTYRIAPLGQHDMILKGKFSGLDPWLKIDGKMIKLTEYDANYAKEFTRIKEIKKKGWPIKFITL
jgi:hypothetical protein